MVVGCRTIQLQRKVTRTKKTIDRARTRDPRSIAVFQPCNTLAVRTVLVSLKTRLLRIGILLWIGCDRCNAADLAHYPAERTTAYLRRNYTPRSICSHCLRESRRPYDFDSASCTCRDLIFSACARCQHTHNFLLLT